MKKFVYTVSLVGLILLFIWQICGLLLNRQENANDETDLIEPYDIESIVVDEISNAFIQVPLNLDKIKVYDFQEDTIVLSGAVGKSGNTYIARFSTSSCRICINHLMSDLQLHASADSSASILVIISNAIPRDLNVFAAQYERRYEFYGAQEFPLDFDGGMTPAKFQVDTGGIVAEAKFYLPNN